MKKCQRKMEEMCERTSDLEDSFESLKNIVTEIITTQTKKPRRRHIRVDSTQSI